MCDILPQNIHGAVYAFPWDHQQNKAVNTAYCFAGIHPDGHVRVSGEARGEFTC